MSAEQFQAFVNTLPEVRQAQAVTRRAREQAAQARIEEQLREISRLDPAVKGLGDLARMANYPRLYELVKRGNSLTEAYKLANYDALTQRAAQASKQAALNAARSKEHLAPTAQRGAGAASVPADVKEEYRALNPDATEAEIQQHYNRYLRK